MDPEDAQSDTNQKEMYSLEPAAPFQHTQCAGIYYCSFKLEHTNYQIYGTLYKNVVVTSSTISKRCIAHNSAERPCLL